MGFEQAHSISEIYSKIRAMVTECNRLDVNDIVGWGIKQDLYQLRDIVNDALKACPEYSKETEWLKTQEQKKLIKLLKGSND